jgi:hypothetical protein
MGSGSDAMRVTTSGLIALLCIGTVLVYAAIGAIALWWFLR